MPVVSRTAVTGTSYVRTKFQTIDSVQSYLIAFIVSDFKNKGDSAAIPQRVYAKPKSVDEGHADYALEVSTPILLEFVKYLGRNYSLPKMDQAAMPDFDAGKKPFVFTKLLL